MAEVKLTKNELRDQQTLLSKLQKYLPTLQLKKAMLQSEVQETRLKLEQVEAELKILRDEVESFCALLSTQSSIEPLAALKVKNVHKRYENVAGVEVPYYEGVDFVDFHYNLFASKWGYAQILCTKTKTHTYLF